MNKNEFKAINMIARKMNWQNKPVIEVCEIINQMVRNQQALELDCCGVCDGPEETLGILRQDKWVGNKTL